MAKMKELSAAIDELLACGQGLLHAAEAMKAALSEEPEETPAAEPEKTYSFTDVRKVASAKSHAGFTAQVKALIAKYGASSLSSVKEEDLGAFMAELEGIG